MKQLILFVCLIGLISTACRLGSVSITELNECWVFIEKPDVRAYQFINCRNAGAELISIHGTYQNALVAKYAQQKFKDVSMVYIGLEWLHVGRDIGWSWDDGTDTDYLKWADAEPRMSNECVTLNVTDSSWYSNGCIDKYPAICRVYSPK